VPKVFHDFLPKLERDDLCIKDVDYVIRSFHIFPNQKSGEIMMNIFWCGFIKLSTILYLIDMHIIEIAKILLTPYAGF